MNFKEGVVIAIDKPYRMSSFGALAHVRMLCSRRQGAKVKMGHAGTLDPLATGVLILCTGKMTKRIEEFQQHTKEYVATLQLGGTTASHDMEHEVEATFPTDHVTREQVDETLKSFVGDIQQIPPSFSACNVNGKRAYQLSRKGREVTLAPKTVHIEEIELSHYDDQLKQATIRVVCGKGTYIRSLARDIGEALGCGAYLTALRRTRVGDVRVEQCHDFDTFETWLNQQEIEKNI
jgi:tRNA pseudouridine55 synthase